MNLIDFLFYILLPFSVLLYVGQAFYFIFLEILEHKKHEKELKEYQENLEKNS